MNDSTRVIRRPRWAWQPRARTAAALLIATAVLALLAAACGGNPSSTGSGGSSNAGRPTSSPSTLAFSRCMRSHGVPQFPEPDGSGGLPKVNPQDLGVSNSQFQAAQSACQNLLPNDASSLEQCERADVCTPAELQQLLNAGLRFAQCMRSHGVPKWPDPTTDGQRAVFQISISRDGFDPHSPEIRSKAEECMRLTPGDPGVGLRVSS